MSHYLILIIQLKIRTVIISSGNKSGKVILIHIHQALREIIFFIIYIVSTHITTGSHFNPP